MKSARVIPAYRNSGKQLAIPAFFILVTIFFANPNVASAQTTKKKHQQSLEYTEIKKNQFAIIKRLSKIEAKFIDVKKDLSELKQLLKQLQQAQAERQIQPAPAPPAAQAKSSETPPVQTGPQPQVVDAKPSAQDTARPVDAKPRVLSIAGAPYLGKRDAPLTLVEFSDYQCPYCSRHATQTMPQIVQTYVETGKLKYVQREFPLAKLHPSAPKAAEAALCAGDQGKYWDMHDQLYKNQHQLDRDDLATHAETIGLDMAGFATCLDGNKYTQRVQSDIEDGAKAGVKATPSFFLGLTDTDDPNQIKDIIYYQGAHPYKVFQSAIDQLLARLSKKGP